MPFPIVILASQASGQSAAARLQRMRDEKALDPDILRSLEETLASPLPADSPLDLLRQHPELSVSALDVLEASARTAAPLKSCQELSEAVGEEEAQAICPFLDFTSREADHGRIELRTRSLAGSVPQWKREFEGTWNHARFRLLGTFSPDHAPMLTRRHLQWTGTSASVVVGDIPAWNGLPLLWSRPPADSGTGAEEPLLKGAPTRFNGFDGSLKTGSALVRLALHGRHADIPQAIILGARLDNSEAGIRYVRSSGSPPLRLAGRLSGSSRPWSWNLEIAATPSPRPHPRLSTQMRWHSPSLELLAWSRVSLEEGQDPTAHALRVPGSNSKDSFPTTASLGTHLQWQRKTWHGQLLVSCISDTRENRQILSQFASQWKGQFLESRISQQWKLYGRRDSLRLATQTRGELSAEHTALTLSVPGAAPSRTTGTLRHAATLGSWTLEVHGQSTLPHPARHWSCGLLSDWKLGPQRGISPLLLRCGTDWLVPSRTLHLELSALARW